MDAEYNGWSNRNTWAVNLHWGDYWQSLAEEGLILDAIDLRADVDWFIEEAMASVPEGQRLFIEDMLDLSDVNWNELARHYEQENEDA